MSEEFEKINTSESPSTNDSTVKSNSSENTGVENLLEGDAEKFESVNSGGSEFKIDWNASPNQGSGLRNENTASSNAKSKAMTTLLNADVILWGVDTLLSRLGVMIGNLSGVKSTKEDWKLDDKEKAEIKPILEATIKEENWTHIPAKWILAGVVLVIYATKIQIVSDKEKLRKQKESKLKDDKLSNDLDNIKERVKNNEVFDEEDETTTDKLSNTETERKKVLLEIRKRLLTDKTFIFEKDKLPFDVTQDEIDFLLEDISGYTKYGTKIGRPSKTKKGGKDIEDADFILVK